MSEDTIVRQESTSESVTEVVMDDDQKAKMLRATRQGEDSTAPLDCKADRPVLVEFYFADANLPYDKCALRFPSSCVLMIELRLGSCGHYILLIPNTGFHCPP